MKEIWHDNRKMAVQLDIHDIGPGLSFFTDDSESLQLGSWRYESGKLLAAHNHNRVERRADRTQEFIIVLKGGLKASIYSESDAFIEELTLKSGEALLILAGGHGYRIEENDTVVLEVKNGPYPGADLDRRRIEVKS